MMDTEIHNFLFVWISVVASLIYCHSIAKFVPAGSKRLVVFFPVILLFFALPLNLTSISLGGLTSFFVAWLCNFKLLLFAYSKGPLNDLPLPLFLSIASLPIKVRPSSEATGNGGLVESGLRSPLNYVAKCLLLLSFFPVYQRNDLYVPEKVMLLMYSIHMYIGLEVAMAAVGAAASQLIGMAVEPQFDEPYLATSLQDFWGRRWNLMVTSVLRPTVYEPVRSASCRWFGKRWAPLLAVMATFAVSAVMHEVIFYYIGRKAPVWPPITCFFLLHGVAVAAEVAIKKSTKWQLPAPVSRAMTVGFVVVTGFWLFLPPLLRCGAVAKARRDTIVVIELVRWLGGMLRFRPFTIARYT